MSKEQRLLDEVIKMGEIARGFNSRFVLSLPPGALEKVDWSTNNLCEWYQTNQPLLQGASLERIDTDTDRAIVDTYLLALEVTQRMSIEASMIPGSFFEDSERVR